MKKVAKTFVLGVAYAALFPVFLGLAIARRVLGLLAAGLRTAERASVNLMCDLEILCEP